MGDEISRSLELDILTIDDVDLPQLACKELHNKKVESLAKKYHSIPEDDWWFYPYVSNVAVETDLDKEILEKGRRPQKKNQTKTPKS